jgi:peptidoglycan hydrolase CwlO-like protein
MDPSTGQVVVAAITAVSAIVVAVIGVQWRVHRDNRSDHGETAAKVDRLLENQVEIQHDVRLIRADVTDLHGAITELRHSDHVNDARVTRLERKNRTDGGDAA